ncbi:MAG: c-type cytochrome [Marinomonas sp.]|jgi:cytochrome c553|uniref:c-type cytochrome n=1 Tax=unclassified Marinomonas TaxID=196814 RepID=UPI0005FA7A0B|nr:MULTISPECIES: c-type cytochrome [unclassified Marinomonas]KJZ15919.1 cytochrome C [Marinomonas sp. S3726]KZM43163.1 cytochrome C [Marinomonas sp. SBI22]KZM44734.1 cytochrome C [Marinomonas sp. SBI8L]
MKKVLIGMLVAMGASSAAVAQGNPEAGKELTTVCAACHGADGNSALANFPKLAGQQEGYLLKQLKDIKSGSRPVTEMTGLLDGYNNQNLSDIAAYFASNPVVTGQADPELVEAGKAVYRTGNPKTGVPACMACHGPAGKGLGSAAFPALAGQHADYTAAQLKKFQSNERVNDPAKIMQDIAFKMNDREIKAVSSYIQGLY